MVFGCFYLCMCEETGLQYSTDEMFSRISVVASIKCRWPLHPGYMHSFGITDNYFVIVEQPLSVSLSTALVNRFNGDPLSNALKWFQDSPVSITIHKIRIIFIFRQKHYCFVYV